MKKEKTGLRICFDKNVDVILKKAFVHFASWLRCHYDFPKRVPVYVKESYFIINRFSEEQVLATFFAPFDKQDVPCIRIATGDFYDLEQKHGSKDAMLMILHSLAHELQHYYQWIEDKELIEDGVEEGADELIVEYIEDGFEEFWFSILNKD